MKIVHVIPGFFVGGGQLLAVRLCTEIKRQVPNNKLYILSLYDSIPTIVYEEAVTSGATIITFNKKLGIDWFLPFRILKILLKIQPDVIHTHLAGLKYTLLSSLFLKKVCKCHTIHNMASYEASPIERYIQKKAFNLLGWIPVSLSQQINDSVVKEYAIDSPIIGNGIKVEEKYLNQSKEYFRDINNFSQNKFIIITIGRLWIQKNQLLLIEAFEDIHQQHEDAMLIIVGEDPADGSYRRKLEKTILGMPYSVRENIKFLGNKNNIPELLRASDLFVLTSDWEGVPLTLLEAMGYKVPIVSTAVGGIGDIIDNDVEGLLVPKGDKISFVSAVNRVINSPHLSNKLITNAKKRFDECYTIEATAKKYLNLYHGMPKC